MNGTIYRPEGYIKKDEPITLNVLERARCTDKILEAKAVLCDNCHNLIVDLDGIKGIVPREEAAIGIREGTVGDIAVLSRVNKQICFKVNGVFRKEGEICASLSRLSAQKDALEHMLSNYRKGDVINAKITHMEPFGAFADIGCGIVGLISIENISVSRISHPKDRFYIGQNIKTVIRDVDIEKKRFTLSHKELLGTWQENASLFGIGETVCGKVRSVEEYGIFVELTPNLTGLAEYRCGITAGQQATVFIKNIIPEKMKVKLSIIDNFYDERMPYEHRYFISDGHINKFIYSPPESVKNIETDFT